jgi:hypothetical protein
MAPNQIKRHFTQAAGGLTPVAKRADDMHADVSPAATFSPADPRAEVRALNIK